MFFRKISDELQQSYDDLNCDIKNTFQGKNAGKILRLAGILSYMFRVLDKESCMEYEKQRADEFESTPCTVESLDINCLGMDASINLVDLSHKQMMSLFGFFDEKEQMNEITDIGKVLLSGGKCLISIRLNKDRIVGRKTNKQIINDIFSEMENLQFGNMTMRAKEIVFNIRSDLVDFAKESMDFRKILYANGIALSTLEESMAKEDRASKSYVKSDDSKSTELYSLNTHENENDNTLSNKCIMKDIGNRSTSTQHDRPNLFKMAHSFMNSQNGSQNDEHTVQQKKRKHDLVLQKAPKRNKFENSSRNDVRENPLRKVLNDISNTFKHSTPIRNDHDKNINFECSIE